METKRKSQAGVQVVITPTPEEQEENQIVKRRILHYHFLSLLTEAGAGVQPATQDPPV